MNGAEAAAVVDDSAEGVEDVTRRREEDVAGEYIGCAAT